MSRPDGHHADDGCAREFGPGVHNLGSTPRLAELDALRAALARVEALRVEWDTGVLLSRRFAANELRRAMEGSDE